jgi:hypothetical protein
MKTIQKSYDLYSNLGYWFLLLFALAFVGFFTSYILVIFQPAFPILHIHFILMALWMVMLIAQPFLIKYKKFATHRLLGKISYVLVPLVLASAFLMLRQTYYREINLLSQQATNGVNTLNNEQILSQVRALVALPFVWFFWFIIFYSLAIINRKKPAIHARYMLATGLSLFGPIIDRIVFKFENIATFFPPVSVAFLLADFVLILVLWKDYKDKRPMKTLGIALLIYVIGQVLYFTIPTTTGWQHFVALVMEPKP